MLAGRKGILLLIVAAAPACIGTSALVERVEAFRAAKESGDFARARGYLSDDPRVWYEAREGQGSPLVLGAGRFRAWDEHFNSSGTLGPWTIESNTVWAVATEVNDYYRLLERRDVAQYRITYFFNKRGKIEGYLISRAYPGRPAPPRRDRFEEFRAWAEEHHPEEWAYLRPGGELDPTGDRAPRTRRLLELWRESVGLPPIP